MPVVDQLSVVLLPAVIVVELAPNVRLGAITAAFTVIVTDLVTVPAPFEHARLYVVVDVGDTDLLPLVGWPPANPDPLPVHVIGAVPEGTFQFSVVLLPAVIVVAVALKFTPGATAAAVTVTVTDFLTVPYSSTQVSV